VRCSLDGTGSARQAIYYAEAFNQNIGSWNTASVSNMYQVCALVPSHACGVRPKSFRSSGPGRKRSPAQMWGRPTSDVGESRRRCGRVQARMWVRFGLNVNESCVFHL
jgi:surface protein